MANFTGNGFLKVTHSINFSLCRYEPRINVQFYGRFKGKGSIANVCRQWCVNLHAASIELGICDYSEATELGDSALEPLWSRNPRAPIAIFYGFPQELDFHELSGHKTLIGAFVCETDQISREWIERCNRLHLVVVPSSFCKGVFQKCGVEVPVMVVPHGLEPEYRPYPGLVPDHPFTFYNVFSMHSNLARKSAKELVTGFLSAFQGKTDVRLVLRTENEGEILSYQQLPGFDSLIEFVSVGTLDTLEYAQYFSRVHCTVHPSKSEGFGFVPLQSIACGTPVIAARVTGMKDYLTSGNSVELRTNGLTQGSGYDQQGMFPDIDEKHLIDQMMMVYDNWKVNKKQALSASVEIQNEWAWSQVLSSFVSLVERLGEVSDP